MDTLKMLSKREHQIFLNVSTWLSSERDLVKTSY